MRPQSAPTRPPPPPPGLSPRVPPHGAVSVRHLPSQIPSRKRKLDDNYPTGKKTAIVVYERDWLWAYLDNRFFSSSVDFLSSIKFLVICWTPKYTSVSEASEYLAFRGQWLKTNFTKVFMKSNMACILLFAAELYWISMIFSQKNLWPRSTLTSVLIREVKRPSFRGVTVQCTQFYTFTKSWHMNYCNFWYRLTPMNDALCNNNN